MPVIGLLTRDFKVYYEMVRHLKGLDIPFVSLSFEDPIPSSVGVIITTKGERGLVDFKKVVQLSGNLEDDISTAVRLLSGKERYAFLAIGIDPGDTPGIAVIGDGQVLETCEAPDPESAEGFVGHAVRSYPADKVVLRIGHGDVTKRNRILRAISGLGLYTEIVDETSTSGGPGGHGQAAAHIASMRGHRARESFDVQPSPGELRDIQRRSRRMSGGRVTISQELAERVALGEITLDEAVRLHSPHSASEGDKGGHR